MVSKLQQVYTSIFCFHILSTLCFILSQDGWTALMLASDSGHTDVVKLLLSSGAQVDLQDKVRHIVNLLILIVHKTDGCTCKVLVHPTAL